MLKTLARLTLGLILLLVVAGVFLLVSVNTEQNKAAIQAAVLSSTGYELTIAGDMDIAFFPSIGLTLNDVRLKNPASPQELASTSAALLQVDLRALIGGEILVRELSTDDFHINYYIDAQGKSNWDTQDPAVASSTTPSTAPAAPQQANSSTPAASGSSSVIVSIERVRIGNASIDIQDLSQGQRYSINNLDLVSNNTNIDGRPFDVEMSFNFLNDGMSKPMMMGLRSDITADMNAGTVNMQNIAFNLTPMLLQGSLSVRGLQDEISFEGSLASNDFDAFGLLQTMGMREDAQDAASSLQSAQTNPMIRLETSFNGNQSSLSIPSLVMYLADSRIETDASIRFASNLEPANISYEIVSNQIDVTPFLSAETPADIPATAGDATSTTPGVNVDEQPTADFVIPSEVLNSFNVLGSIAIESIVANELLFSGVNIFTNVEDGVMDVEIQPVSAFEGSIAGNIRLDGRASEAALVTQLTVQQLNLVDLAPSISQLDSVTGKLDVEIDLSATGQTSSAMLESLSGSTAFAITENSVDIGVIKQVFTAISALSPRGGTTEQWPDVIRFTELGGFVLFNEGIRSNQQLNLRMDNFDVSGTGGIDLSQQNFDYDLQFTILGSPYVQTIPVDELYHDVGWPVECAASFDDEVSQYCRPDFTQVREIFTQLGTNAIRDRVEEAISDQLPPEVRDGARGLLRNLLN